MNTPQPAPEQDLNARLASLEKKLDATLKALNQIRKYFLWTFIVSIAFIVLPLIGLVFVIPKFITSFSQYSQF